MKPDTKTLLLTAAVIWAAGGGAYFVGNSLNERFPKAAHESAGEEHAPAKPAAAEAQSAPAVQPAPAPVVAAPAPAAEPAPVPA
ncbi:hypothetical protein, partial [Methylocystis parvus]